MKELVKSILNIAFVHWQPYSRLLLIADQNNWVINNEIRELRKISSSLGIKTPNSRLFSIIRNQTVFFGNYFDVLLHDNILRSKNRLGTAYFHGKPGTGVDGFDRCYENLIKYHNKISRIQVSYSEMEEIILETGISSDKVFRIPIGINTDFFTFQSPESKIKARQEYGVPVDAMVVGSFQKDGDGWGEGMSPKLIKGPDIFLKVVEMVKRNVPELFVLLSGPARGYMKRGLDQIGIPYKHVYLENYQDIGKMYHALDAYLVSSREEGGPKAVLESMATGIPLVTTRVGQSMDLVEHEKNGWILESTNIEGLAHYLTYVLDNRRSIGSVLAKARSVAEANTYTSQSPAWKDFMEGYVNM